ncbi:MAG: CopG family transcriptional regulator [Cyanobium sp.]
MRTTLQLDDDVPAAARVLARQRRVSLGAVISELARRALMSPPQGLPLLPWIPAGAPVDLELVTRLRDDAPSLLV